MAIYPSESLLPSSSLIPQSENGQSYEASGMIPMRDAEWLVIPREANLARTADPISYWSSLKLIERHNTPDTWTVVGPSEHMGAFAPGTGCILTRDGDQITSGKMTNLHRGRSANPEGFTVDTTTATFTSDLLQVGHRIVTPSPGFTMPLNSVFQFPAAYDLRTGAIETLIINYIRAHAGDQAVVDRRISRLRVPASLARGGNTQVSGRFDHLGVLVQTLAEAGNLRIRIVHTEDANGAWMDLVIDQIQDLSADVRFGTSESASAGIITDWDYEIGMPTTTRAIVAGGGELADRDILQRRATAAETMWGIASETLVDQRQVDPTTADKLAELTRAGDDELKENAGLIKVAFTPALGPDLQYRRDVRVGDIVGYDLPGLDPAKDKIREATTVVTVTPGQQTETVSVVVGTPDAPTTRTQQQTARALRAINVIQRSP